jgi:integrase/recombinase XerD
MTFDAAIAQFAAWLMLARGRSRATVESYQRDLEQFSAETKVGLLQHLDRSIVNAWKLGMGTEGKNYAPRSQARKLSALRAFVSWALEYGHLSENPISPELKVLKTMYLPHALTEAEIRAMLDVVTVGIAPTRNQLLHEALNTRDLAILEVLYASGMRVSELTGLRLVDLHLAEGFAMVTGKGNKQRLVPLGQYAIEALKVYIADARDALCKSAMQHGEVFLSQRGPISRSQVFRIIKDVAVRAGITSKVSPHTFRHSCASHLLAHGADLRLVQELLGHSALSTTQVYTHIEKTQLRKVYDACHPMA